MINPPKLVSVYVSLIEGDSMNLFFTIVSEIRKEGYVLYGDPLHRNSLRRFFRTREDYAEYLMIKYPGRIVVR